MTINPFLARFSGMAAALVAPESQTLFESCLTHAQMSLAAFEARCAAEPAPTMADDFWFAPDDWRAAYRPYVVKDGVLHIPIKGVLLNDFGYALGDWATGYTYIWKAFERGMADPEVKGIALICHTPGGEVAGNFDLVDKMYELAHAEGAKPVRGYAHEAAYSAGYSIISVCTDGITISRTGGVGSIGVVTSHMDVSQAMAADGYKVTFIYAGKHKVDGNRFEALPDDVKARIQGRIDTLYDVFVSTVARNRPVLSEQEIRDTEALTFTANEAVANKLADTIGSLDSAVAAFAANLSNPGDENMADPAVNTAADQAAALETAVASARAEGTKAGATAEKSRIVAILASDAAKERPASALAAALETDMTAEQASAFLGKLPVEKTAAVAPAPAAEGTQGGGTNAFTERMNQEGGPGLGASTDGTEAKTSRSDRAFAAAGRDKPKA